MDVEVVGCEIIDEGEGEVDEARKSTMGVEELVAAIGGPGPQEPQGH